MTRAEWATPSRLRRLLGVLRRASVDALAAAVPWCAQRAGIREIRTHHVFVSGLDRRSEVWDLGANRGEFSVGVVEAIGCRCFAVEPFPDNIERIPRLPEIETRQAAVSGQVGRATFYTSANCEAGSLHPRVTEVAGAVGAISVELETLASLAARRGRRPDLVKLDIEGAEIDVLNSATDEELRAVAQWTIEFHDFVEAAQLGPAVQAAKARFARLGFIEVATNPEGNHDCLFILPARCGLTTRQRVLLFVLRRVLLPLRVWFNRLSRVPLS